MNLRKPTLIANDADNFPSYLVDAGLGTVGIPGTTMLSATIIRKKDVRGGTVKLQYLRAKKSQQCRTDDMVMQVDCWAQLAEKVPDGTMTVEAAIGVSFLAAETSRAPFRGSFTTVSRKPHMFPSNWTNTADFVRVLRDLIPPLAPYKQDAPADMVKRVFVFSDVQSNTAELRAEGKWQ
ncbi:hypothetical protein MY3296_003099 [Beauveria thailandica]